MTGPDASSELDRLMAGFLTDTLSPEEGGVLLRKLEGSQDLRRELAGLTEIDHALLHLGRTRKEADGEKAAEFLQQIERRLGSDARLLEKVLSRAEGPSTAERHPDQLPAAGPAVVTRRASRPWWMAIPVAACLAITFALILWDRVPGGPSRPSKALGIEIVFQDGFSPQEGYRGTKGTWLNDEHPSRSYGADEIIEVEDSDGKPGGRPALLSWDVTAFPAGSRVLSATITLDLSKGSSKRPCRIYEVRRNWSEAEANWTRASVGEAWELPGARGARDRGSVVLGSFVPRTGSCTIELNPEGVALVQSWVDAPSSNHGLLLVIPDSEGKIAFRSRHGGDPDRRPRLRLEYLPATK